MGTARVLGLVLICLLSSSCCCSSSDDDASSSHGDPGAGGSGGGAVYDKVTVEPPDVDMVVELGKTGSQSYQAYADVDGKKTEITGVCSWAVEDAFGTMNGPEL